ncbi:MAG: aminopeptidase [Janthinobacterium lividum]
MKNIFSTTGWLLSLLLTAGPALGQNYEQIAKQIVNTSAGVKPGELVMITGGQHTLPLMEAVAVEVARVGGQPRMVLSTDKVGRAINLETPESAIQTSKSDNWTLQSDVLISLPPYENAPAVLASVSPERRVKFSQVAATFTKQLDGSKVRTVSVAYPSKSVAAQYQLDYPAYEQMIWSGIGADYITIAGQASQLKQLLATGKKMHITSPDGTDLTLELGGRPVFADDGELSAADQQEKLIYNRTASLPGGRIYGTCQETTAMGHLGCPNMIGASDGQPLNGFKADLKNGELVNMRADTGVESLQKMMAPYGPAALQVDRFSIGLNPVMKTQKDLHPTTAAGMVLVGTGNNALYGGQNQMPGSANFLITNATVDIDGRVIVRSGQLVTAVVASSMSAPKKRRK